MLKGPHHVLALGFVNNAGLGFISKALDKPIAKSITLVITWDIHGARHDCEIYYVLTGA